VSRKAIALFSLLVTLLVINIPSASAQGGDTRSLHWERYDVLLDNFDTAANTFDVTEQNNIFIERGPFSFGTREIPLDRLGKIVFLEVFDGNTALRSSCDGAAGTYCVTANANKIALKYLFTEPASSGTRRILRYKYKVSGALRSYAGGDQVWWAAVPGDRPFPADESRVAVKLATNMMPPHRVATYPDDWKPSHTRDMLIFSSPGSLGKSGYVEVRVQYDHDPRMKPAAWQAGFDLQVSTQPISDLAAELADLLSRIGK